MVGGVNTPNSQTLLKKKRGWLETPTTARLAGRTMLWPQPSNLPATASHDLGRRSSSSSSSSTILSPSPSAAVGPTLLRFMRAVLSFSRPVGRRPRRRWRPTLRSLCGSEHHKSDTTHHFITGCTWRMLVEAAADSLVENQLDWWDVQLGPSAHAASCRLQYPAPHTLPQPGYL